MKIGVLPVGDGVEEDTLAASAVELALVELAFELHPVAPDPSSNMKSPTREPLRMLASNKTRRTAAVLSLAGL